jgi:hypothetical protein
VRFDDSFDIIIVAFAFARESRIAKSGRRDNNIFGIADNNEYYHAASWRAGQGQKMAT